MRMYQVHSDSIHRAAGVTTYPDRSHWWSYRKKKKSSYPHHGQLIEEGNMVIPFNITRIPFFIGEYLYCSISCRLAQ